ncbi:heparan-alpha-glucosaminide N-acetyltransferase domain-containing protein [Microbacterium marinum]
MTQAWRSWNGPARLHGIDLARALAVLGMLAAHLITIDESFELGRPETWIDLVNGRSSVLFAVLAGVSLALVSGGIRGQESGRLATTRRRIAVRAAALWIIGAALIATGVPVYVILPAYAILFVLALPALRVRPGILWAIAAAILVGVPWFLPAIDLLPVWESDSGETVFLLLGWAYPFPLWIGFVLLGMAIGRSDLRRPTMQVLLLAGGVAVAVTAAIAASVISASAVLVDAPYLDAVWSASPHSSGILDAVGSAGVALAVTGACLLLCRTPLTWLLAPLRAVGSMPLTAYVGQIVAWAIAAALLLGDTGDLYAFRDLQPFWWFVAGAVLACTAWASIIGQGPLEWLLARLARAVVPERQRDAADRVDT